MKSAQQTTAPAGLHWLFLLSMLILAYLLWEDVVRRQADGTYTIRTTTTDKVADRVDRIQNKTEFYKLVAASNGYFLCPLCPPEATSNGRYFLNYNEIYKVGVTMDKASRYSQAELARWNLEYVMIAIGNYADMLILETEFMGSYPLHPENIKRPKHRRLVTPPGSGTTLR